MSSTTIEKPLEVFSASAGSGKTYTLALKFLKLVLEFEDPTTPNFFGYRNILAVTFTNKAAGEMKSRIIEDLAKCAKLGDFDKKSAIALDLKIEIQEVEKRAQKVLQNLLFDYSRFDVLTIDSFVDRVVRAFARENKLPASYDLEIKTTQLKKYLISSTLDAVDTHESLKNWLNELQNSILEKDEKANLALSLGQTANFLLNDEFQTLISKGKDLGDIENGLKNWRSKAKIQLETIQEIISSTLNELVELQNHSGIAPNEFLQSNRSLLVGLINSLNKAQLEPNDKKPSDYELFNHKVNFDFTAKLTSYADFNKWLKKDELKNQTLADTVQNLYIPKVIDICERFNTLQKDFNTIQIIHQNFYQLGILNAMRPYLESYRAENNSILLKDELDIASKIALIFGPEILFEKLGQRYKHLFIDEFQDTSIKQWQFFSPLIEQTTSESHYNLIVGDVKQSIYEWRGGDLTLLQKQVFDDFKGQTQATNLDFNWRSQKEIIGFNNDLFSFLPQAIETEFKAKIGFESFGKSVQTEINSGLTLINSAYSKVQQITPKDKENSEGYIRWTFFDPDQNQEDEDNEVAEQNQEDDIRLSLLLQTVIKLQVERGLKASDIAILVRKGLQAETIAAYFSNKAKNRTTQGSYTLDLISADSIKISFSDSVRVIISSLKLMLKISNTGSFRKLDFNKDGVLKFAITELLAELKRVKPELTNQDWKAFTGYSQSLTLDFVETIIPPAFLETPSKIMRMGLPELVEEIIMLFGLNKCEGQEPYINAFQAFVLNYSQRKGATLQGLLKEFDENESDLKINIPESRNAVKLLTIHTSKGLEYESVIIPYADLELVKSNDRYLTWVSTENTGIDYFSIYPIKLDKQSFNSAFAEKATEKLSRLVLSNLNLIYVACTRAKSQLHFIAPKPILKKDGSLSEKSKGVFSTIIYQQLLGENLNCLGLSKSETESKNTEVYCRGSVLTKPEMNKDTKMGRFLDLGYPSFRWRPKITIRPLAKPTDPEAETLSDKLGQGAFVHELLSQIESNEELEIRASELINEGKFDPAFLNVVVEKIKGLMQQNPMSIWFSKPATVYKELEIWLAADGETPKVKRPDRVVVIDGKTYVIDFKTGKESPQHHQQVKNYCQLLSDMGYTNLEGWLVYIFGSGPVPVNFN